MEHHLCWNEDKLCVCVGGATVTLKDTGMTEADVMEVRDRSLVDAYEVHDVGYDILCARLRASGFTVVDHGDDARHADGVFYGDGPDLAVYECREGYQQNSGGLGSQYIESDTGRFVSPQEALKLQCYIEIKTKEDPAWVGRCNLRHFREYVNFSNEVDVPVFIWFALVDSEEDTGIVHREAFVHVEDTGQIDGDVVDISDDSVVFDPEDLYEVNDTYKAVDGGDITGVRGKDVIVNSIPEVHGNRVIELNDDNFRSYAHFLHQVSE